mmetsp:Transcript_773/g.943  ORF Transcript_773/g.943 Transcript_773/m.943 type:complete len:115 (-) Transcript_773:47-391(-)|eukprot:CAMPEP_0184034808 /NCGR_PEP_ID=MMETSP0955-20130417/19915_1 /TAXON_ID=627963 /ORGANISM="Aplanochytrium sp, Strain PBS07" /LENGTH=114 /DNA_ID=CAMNT_0026321703 /DNA_START=198 /DNA_END=542 /DNA_ORIENTATION=-
MDKQGSEHVVTPRVNASLLGVYTNQKVNFVGKVSQQSPGVIVFDSSDGTQVNIRYHNPSELEVGCIYEMIGVVSPDCSIEGEKAVPYSSNFDLEVYNKFIELAHRKYSHLFYGK